jgi:hypothetical protein
MRIEGWSLVGSFNPYIAPELQTVQLRGHVYGHPNHHDGKLVMTSRIAGVVDEDIITLSGSRYTLGAIDPEYSKLYPNAKDRLLASLKEREDGLTKLS